MLQAEQQGRQLVWCDRSLLDSDGHLWPTTGLLHTWRIGQLLALESRQSGVERERRILDPGMEERSWPCRQHKHKARYSNGSSIRTCTWWYRAKPRKWQTAGSNPLVCDLHRAVRKAWHKRDKTYRGSNKR